MHIFASLYSFSEEAQDEVLSRLRANTLASETHCEWLDSKRLNIVCTDDSTIAALFQLYAEYITAEKDRAREVYEVTKLERPNDTIVATSRDREQFDHPAANLQTTNLSVTLVPHEMISTTWCFDDKLRSHLPKRLLQPSIFEAVASLTHCRIIFGATPALLTVKGDNDQQVKKTTTNLDNLARALSLRTKPPRIHEFVIMETEVDVSLQIRAINDSEMQDQQSTTNMGSNGSRPLAFQEYGVVTMNKKGKGIVTLPKVRTINLHTPNQTDPCHPLRVRKDIARAAPIPNPGCRFVEEWVETTAETGQSHPFEPNKNSVAGELLAGSDVVGTFEETQASAKKRRHGRNRKNPTASVEVRYENHADVQEALEPRSTPSEQPASYAQDPAHDVQKAKTEERLRPPGVEDTVDLDRLLSLNDRQKSTSPCSVGTSAQVSATIPDLLPEDAPQSAYSVHEPAPSIRSPYLPAESSRTSHVLGEHQPTSSIPGWMKQNPTTGASGIIRGGSFLNTSNAALARPQPISYLDAAKRGALSPRGAPRARAATGRVDRVPSEQLQPSTEIHSRQIHRTMNKKMAKPARSPASHLQFEAFELAASQLLQSVNVFRGIVDLEVDIGRILIKAGNGAIGRTFLPNGWSSVFNDRAADKPETEFTHRLPASDLDIQHIVSLQQPNGQKIFAEEPYESVIQYRFLCGTKSGDEEYVLVLDTVESEDEANARLRVSLQVDGSGLVQLLSTEYLVGAVNWHFPKRQWDARLAVRVTERIEGSYRDSVEAISRTLSVVPSVDGRTAKIFAELGNTDLIFKSASVHRQMKFRCVAYPSYGISCSEVECIGPPKERQRYYNAACAAAAANNGDRWWEIKLHSTDATDRLRQSKDLPIGAEAEWSANEIVGETVKQLHYLARDIVTQIDGIGIDETTVSATIKHDDESKQAPGEVNGFW
ncbi:MAG: hypothetical protein LQ344_006973 [Seirophora lacunosa]|nr:MAG: hypothetical protein LQ344_006973 [Seirophora lacunosa]